MKVKKLSRAYNPPGLPSRRTVRQGVRLAHQEGTGVDKLIVAVALRDYLERPPHEVDPCHRRDAAALLSSLWPGVAKRLSANA